MSKTAKKRLSGLNAKLTKTSKSTKPRVGSGLRRFIFLTLNFGRPCNN